MKKPIFKRITLLVLGLTMLNSCQKDDDAEQNTPPVIADQSFNASENISDTQIIGKVIATDDDKDKLSYSIKNNVSNTSGSGAIVVFEIDNDGMLKLKAGESLDYEKSIMHEITVEVSDGKLSSSAKITIDVIDENAAPLIADQTFTITENSALGSTIGTILATDPDGDDLVYFWSSGQSVTKFTLVDNVLKTTATNNQGLLNYEEQNSYTVDVTAGDGLLSTRATMTINITDVNDAPAFDENLNTTLTIPEDVGDTEDLANFTATDEDGDALTYSIKNDTDDLFEIKADGRIELKSGKELDYETKTSHTFTAVVTDPEGASDEVDVTLNVTDIDERPLTGIMVSTIAGSTQGYANGTGSAARFFLPEGLILDGSGALLVADKENQVVRKVTLTGEASYHSGGTGTLMKNPQDIIADGQGNYYVSDIVQEVILKLTPKTSGNGYDVTIFAGKRGNSGRTDGVGTDAQFNNPYGMAMDSNGNIFVADRDNHVIRKITPAGVVSTYAGTGSTGNANGAVTSATFNQPTDVAFDSNGNLIVADYLNHRVRKIDPSGMVTTLAGSSAGDQDGTALNAQFNLPYQLTIDQSDNIYITDKNNRKVKKISALGEVTTIAGGGYTEIDGDARDASFSAVHGIEIDATGNNLYLTTNKTIRKIAFPE